MAPATGSLASSLFRRWYNQTMSTKRKELRTYADRREYLIAAVTKRRRILKIRGVELLGGKCCLCGYDRHPGTLDFHHVDPTTKSFGVSAGGFSRSWKSIENELKKCILVCANCHREIELGLHRKEVIDALHRQLHTLPESTNKLLAPCYRASYNSN